MPPLTSCPSLSASSQRHTWGPVSPRSASLPHGLHLNPNGSNGHPQKGRTVQPWARSQAASSPLRPAVLPEAQASVRPGSPRRSAHRPVGRSRLEPSGPAQEPPQARRATQRLCPAAPVNPATNVTLRQECPASSTCPPGQVLPKLWDDRESSAGLLLPGPGSLTVEARLSTAPREHLLS